MKIHEIHGVIEEEGDAPAARGFFFAIPTSRMQVCAPYERGIRERTSERMRETRGRADGFCGYGFVVVAPSSSLSSRARHERASPARPSVTRNVIWLYRATVFITSVVRAEGPAAGGSRPRHPEKHDLIYCEPA